MYLLAVEHLCKAYTTLGGCVTALDHVSFSVRRGEFISIVGESGSGKSTLLHMLGGVDRPDSGRILLRGIDITAMKGGELTRFRRREIGIIYQFYNLIASLTVRENITLPLELDGRAVDREKLAYLFDLLGLAARAEDYPGQLSGGQQQRVAIARAMLTEPTLVLADEPTGNLDGRNADEIIRLLRESAAELGQTVLLVTHSPDIAARADRTITLSEGKIVSDRRLS